MTLTIDQIVNFFDPIPMGRVVSWACVILLPIVVLIVLIVQNLNKRKTTRVYVPYTIDKEYNTFSINCSDLNLPSLVTSIIIAPMGVPFGKSENTRKAGKLQDGKIVLCFITDFVILLTKDGKEYSMVWSNRCSRSGLSFFGKGNNEYYKFYPSGRKIHYTKFVPKYNFPVLNSKKDEESRIFFRIF